MNRFFMCPCHKIDGVEAVQWSNYTFKITILWECEIWGSFLKNIVFYQQPLKGALDKYNIIPQLFPN